MSYSFCVLVLLGLGVFGSGLSSFVTDLASVLYTCMNTTTAGMVCGMDPRQRGQNQTQTVSPGPAPPTQPQEQPPYSRTPVINY